ncbi:MAG: hypothetical protein AB1509_02250 [Chloroflexota bacterium]
MLNKVLNMRLSEADEAALLLWANADAIDNKSLMMRRIFRLAVRELAPRSIFPMEVITALNLSQDGEA